MEVLNWMLSLKTDGSAGIPDDVSVTGLLQGFCMLGMCHSRNNYH